VSGFAYAGRPATAAQIMRMLQRYTARELYRITGAPRAAATGGFIWGIKAADLLRLT
jgi:hypothetical protein